MFSDPTAIVLSILFMIPAVIVAVPVHELGHALAAHLQGDRTPMRNGYFVFPPRYRTFFDPYGLLAAALWNVSWGSPAPVNEYKLAGVVPKLIYALGGPAANLAVAAVCALILRALGTLPLVFVVPGSGHDVLVLLVFAIYFLNLASSAFNLLPVPGLDGWRVIEALFRSRNPKFFFEAWSRRREIISVLIVIVFVSQFINLPLLSMATSILFRPLSSLLVGTCVGYEFLIPCQL